MSNHLSYLDIPALGSIIKGSFVAKQEVEGWALFGFLSKLQQTAFISRKGADARNVKGNLQTMLDDQKDLIIFPEGTSTDGQAVRLFKSSLFALALAETSHDLYVQPVTIRLKSTNNKPITTQYDRDLYAWHIDMDMELDTHLWRFAKTGGAQIDIIFHTPLAAKTYDNRKKLAQNCHDAVSHGLLKGEMA